ncbi:metal-dependent hydrolase [Bacterioplanes sanyensis]|uniref:Metal-dependent hydrolase n=1 Tax=Bacterioplanes sanyensis TaxID=1249553 RepID=A0A222FL99_9GAMM|nr:metal-dependent hydrolase [Bacterioplanes sanyensis]ASP39151.1 metal-dependent hydrolase [Bacterioplanes sanyensis]
MNKNNTVTKTHSSGHYQPEIKPRRMAFDTKAPENKYTFNNNSLVSTFFYALSALFPDGERFFIHSVRHYRDQISDPELKQQIKGFIGQEAHHGHSHEALNESIESLGFPMSKITSAMQSRIEMLKKFSPPRQLALTVAMEHFTASLAEFLLKNTDLLEQIDPTIRQMLIWHAVEEIEHKAVAFDVYRTCVDNEFMRKRVMVIAMVSLFSRLAWYQTQMLWADRHFPSWREWKEAASFFWGKRGILRDNMKGLAKFFRTGFHPWDIDQQALIDNWQQRFPDVAALQR